MDKEALKAAVCSAIDAAKADIEKLALCIESEPELGFKETKTAKKVEDYMRSLGLDPRTSLALTGVKARVKGGKPGPSVAVLAELDAIGTPDSPKADPLTGAAHTCGHFLQTSVMLAACTGIIKSGVMKELAGDAVFFSVPAEEYVEITYRKSLREQGKLHYICGNGFVGKTVQYIGKPAHAANAPHEGINALNAACLGLMGINALRETFQEKDIVRVHPIITKGGDLVNNVPSDVRMELYVRAATMEAIDNTHKRVDAALKAGGDAVGAQTIVETLPGMLPLHCCKEMNDLFVANVKEFSPETEIVDSGHFSASTDMGDVSHLMPAIHPFIGGTDGALHTKDFTVTDFDAAVITPAKAFARMIVDLLYDDAACAKKILADNKPLLTKEEYIAKCDSYFSK